MKNLRQNGYIEMASDGHITLTESGLAIATSVLERHTLLTSWLVSVGVDPALMGTGPIPSVRQALKKAGLEAKDIDLFELNEAFAAQAAAVNAELGLTPDNVNVNGGAIAIGHPIGASGARILVTLCYEMARRESKYGVASLCIGGGIGEALIVERV